MVAVLSCDLAIVGGGLAGGLIALALAEARPALDVRLVESGARIGGDHLWSFLAGDIDADDRWIVAPLISHGWPAYRVRLATRERRIETGCHVITAPLLDAAVRGRLRDRAMTGCKALAANAHAVVLADGRRIEAKGVIDARGAGDLTRLECGWRTAVGHDLDLAAPHGRDTPMIADTAVAQIDGGRLIRALPLSPTRMTVEDIRYGDTPDIDAAASGARIRAYAEERGWTITTVARAETGVLPVVMGGNFESYWQSGGHNVAKAGIRAGLFHPTTGHALPDAVRTAALIARQHDYSGAALHDLLHDAAKRIWTRRRFHRMLARLLFRAATPETRHLLIDHFHRLDPARVGRFYAGRSTMGDKMRILTGKPPVPIGRAISAMLGRPA